VAKADLLVVDSVAGGAEALDAAMALAVAVATLAVAAANLTDALAVVAVLTPSVLWTLLKLVSALETDLLSFLSTKYLNATQVVPILPHATSTAKQMLKTTHAFTLTDALTQSLATLTQTQTATTVLVLTPVATMRQPATMTLMQHATTVHASLLLTVQASAVATSLKMHAETATIRVVKMETLSSTSLETSNRGSFQRA
jgi:hypothetical protein